MSPTLNIQRHVRDGPTNSSASSSASSLPTRLNESFDSTFSPSPSFSSFTPTFSNIPSTSTSSSASPPSSSTTSSGTSNSISSSIQSFSSTASSSSSSSATLAFSGAVAVQSPTVASSSTSSTSLSALSSSSDSSTSSSSSIQSSAITSQSFSVTPAPLPFSATDTVASSNFSITGPLITSPASTSSVSTPTSSNKSEALSASTSRFWSNKSAVAGTFTGVAIVALIAILGICLFLWRKHKALHFLDRNLLEKYAISDSRPFSTPSVASEHNSQDFSHEPMNAHANVDPGYYPMHDPFAGTAQNALYTGGASLPEITYHYAQDVNNQYPYYSDEANNNPQLSSGTRFTTTPASSQNPFEPAPSRNPFEPAIDTARERTQVSPDSNEPVSRTSAAYPPSLDDSFYAVSTEGRTI